MEKINIEKNLKEGKWTKARVVSLKKDEKKVRLSMKLNYIQEEGAVRFIKSYQDIRERLIFLLIYTILPNLYNRTNLITDK